MTDRGFNFVPTPLKDLFRIRDAYLILNEYGLANKVLYKAVVKEINRKVNEQGGYNGK
jgi:hypothetical protein